MPFSLVPDQAIFDVTPLVRIGACFIDNRQECIKWCRQYGLLATQMTYNRYYRQKALDRVVDGVTWRCPAKVCKKRIASSTVAFLKNHTCSYGKCSALPMCGVELLESQGKCPWQTSSMNCKSRASIP